MTTASAPTVTDLVDTDRYPLSPGSARWEAAVARARRELGARGCCVLPGFLRPSPIGALRAQCASVAPSAHHDVESVNVYNTAPDPSLPEGHPVRTTMERGNAFVARDRLAPDLIVSRLCTPTPRCRRSSRPASTWPSCTSCRTRSPDCA